MLSGEHITVRYGNCTVVDDLSFQLSEGEWLMLAGPNGAGKSTLIEAIAQGVPYSGSIRWNQVKMKLHPYIVHVKPLRRSPSKSKAVFLTA